MALSYRTSARVQAPVEVVWQVMTEVEAMPECSAAMSQATAKGSGRLRLGSEVCIVRSGLPRATWVVDVWQPMVRFAWSSRAPVRVRAEHAVTAVDGHQSDVSVAARFDDPSGPTMRIIRQIREHLDIELAELKVRSELEWADRSQSPA
jgi:uncharacterized membrane protein